MEINCLFIIRSASERTVSVCKQLIAAQGVSATQIITVEEVPFSAAMRKSFELGIASGFKYTFCVDADVLLRPGSIKYMIDQFEKLPENVCEIQGLVIDKFFGGPRQGGIHLYSSALLPEILKRIPDEGVNIRPETYTLNEMKAIGFPWLVIPYIVGIHDDFQYNEDIYRKCFVHGSKHLTVAHLMLSIWKRNQNNDPDFKVALKAFSDSLIFSGELYIDKSQSVYSDGFQKSGFSEKALLNVDTIDLDTIEEMVITFKVDENYLKIYPDRQGLDRMEKDAYESKSLRERSREIYSRKGIFKSILYIIGRVFFSIGYRLNSIVLK